MAAQNPPEVVDFTRWANTDRQREILQALAKASFNINQAAKALKVSKGTVGNTFDRIKQRAARDGYAPELDHHHPVPEGFLAKGVSTLYGPDGDVKAQWVKSTIDRDRQEVLLREMANAAFEDLPPLPPTKAPKNRDEDLANLYILTDVHLGMLAWPEETGGKWDLATAEATVLDAFMRALNQSPPAGTAIISQLGDFLHYDSLEAVTPSNRHVLDADSRYPKIVAAAIRIIRRLIEETLKTHKEVLIIIAEGNHDLAGSVWLRQMIQALYENEKRLTVDSTILPYYSTRFGDTMLGFHHGHLKRPGADLALLFADSKDWQGADFRYIHTGDKHHAEKKEFSGVVIEQHPTIAAKDAYAARGGWNAQRALHRITYHKKKGEHDRGIIRP